MATKSRYTQPALFGVKVPGDGPQPARVMLVGERPGRNEPKAGVPFIGAAGKELDRYLRLAGLKREEVYVTNLVKDYTDEDPSEEEILRDLPELLVEIESTSPSLIVPMGRFAIRFFLGDVDVERVHGLLHFTQEWGAVYPVFHPAAGIHNGDVVPFIHSDFWGLHPDRIGDRIVPVDQHPDPLYCQGEPHDRLYPASPLALDSEGYIHDPWYAQWSQVGGHGILVARDREDVLGGFRDQLSAYQAAGGTVYIHNSLHDLGVFARLGCPIGDGSFRDTMVWAYLLCTHPQGLKSLAYRLCGVDMDEYEDVVRPARAVVWGEWMAGAEAAADLIPAPEAELVWDDSKANWRVRQPQTISQRLRRLRSDLDKNPDLDVRKRVEGWGDTAAEALTLTVGEVPEPNLKDIPRADAERYACRDADVTLRIAPILRREIEEAGLEQVAEIDHSIIPMVDRMQQVGFLINPDHFRAMDGRLTERMEALRDQIGDMVGVRINPGSSPQCAQLLFKQLGLPSRKLTRGGDDSTQDKVLEGLRTAHPVVPLILDYRELDKARGSFCRKMPRVAGADGRVRCNLRITRTASGRLAANTPNLMAIPVRSDIGLEIREGFIAPPGRVIYNCDKSQIEMRWIAHYSQDPLMMELFRDPDRDIHAETAARMYSKAVGDVRKVERYAAKRVGFGIATQITGAGLVDQMYLAGAKRDDGSDWTQEQCDDLIVRWYKVYPGVRRWIDSTKAEVRRTGQVRDHWGRLRHLEGVWSTLDRIREEALRQGPSHKIQASAQGHMKRSMAKMWGALVEMGAIGAWCDPLLQIHDSIMFEVDEEMVGVLDAVVMDAMTGSVQLSIPVEADSGYGHNWREAS
jgi:uracil-DNA glycosylase family 4